MDAMNIIEVVRRANEANDAIVGGNIFPLRDKIKDILDCTGLNYKESGLNEIKKHGLDPTLDMDRRIGASFIVQVPSEVKTIKKSGLLGLVGMTDEKVVVSSSAFRKLKESINLGLYSEANSKYPRGPLFQGSFYANYDQGSPDEVSKISYGFVDVVWVVGATKEAF
ncbi:MAG TPA: hypothetical protein VJH92_06200 [Candidatus Nanoarchaeia archaeon]|nr:hypothetical protein [Candidatus Nanoarchaeia archaeon]